MSSLLPTAYSLPSTRGQTALSLVFVIGGIIVLLGTTLAFLALSFLNSTYGFQAANKAAALAKGGVDDTALRLMRNKDLANGTYCIYYIMATSSPFRVATGTEAVLVSTTTYTRFFYLENVYRSAGGEIAASGALDPSTRKITVVYTWPPNASNTIVSYLVRANDEVVFNTDWTGGGNQAGPVTVTTTNSRFATSSSIDYTGQPGSVVITGF